MTAVQLGVFVTPTAEHRDDVLALVDLAEREGLDLVGIQDHPYQRRFLETWSLLAFLAARTERVTLFPDVANLPLRNPAVMAKAAATIDLLSGGRFELGLGAGAFWEAIGAMGGPVRTGPESVEALEEAIAVIRAMWSAERTARVPGRFHALDGVHPGPQPAHDIGIWIGAYGPKMIRLTGRLADGWIPSLPRLPLDELPRRVEALERAASEAGRDPASIRRLANVSPAEGFLDGPAEQWVEQLAALHRRHGFDGFVLWPGDDGREQLVRFAGEVAPALRRELG